MAGDMRPIEVGDRFQTKEKRDEGRVVEVIEDRGLASWAEQLMKQPYATPERREDWRQGGTYFAVRTEAHPLNPDAIGNVSRVSERTLRTKYKRVSR